MSHRIWAAVLIVLEAAAMALLSNMRETAAGAWWDTWVVPLTVSALAVAAAFRWPAWNPSQATLRRTLALLAVAWGTKYLLAPHQYRFFALFLFSSLAHALAQFLLTWQILELWRRPVEVRLPSWFVAVGGVVMICVADVQITPWQRGGFEWITAAWAVTAALCLGSGHARPHSLPHGRATRLLACALVLVIALGLAIAGGRGLFHVTRNFEGLLRLEDAPPPGMRWSQQKTQRRLSSVPFGRQPGDLSISLRVYAAESPGYLKIHAFDRFDRSTWNAAAPTGRLGRFDPTPHPLDDNTTPWPVFRTRSEPLTPDRQAEIDSAQVITLWPSRKLASRIPVPVGVLGVQVEASEVAASADGVLVADELPAGHPCRLLVASQAATETDAAPSGSRLLQLPDQLPAVTRRLATRLFQDCRSDAEKIAAVIRHFQESYGYRFGVSVPPGRDPLEWFLEEQPEAHCEYFATAAAVLLRLGDVPCRYVTGFVVTEYNEFGNHWVARGKDAHAWVEAHDRDRGWILVEATPGAGLPRPASASETNPWWESLRGDVQRRRVEFESAGWLAVLTMSLEWLATIPGMLVIVGGSVLAGRFCYRRFRGRSRRRRLRRDPLARRRTRLLARMDHRLARYALVRAPHETLHQFASRLGNHAAASWYRHFAVALYTGTLDRKTLDQLALQVRSSHHPNLVPQSSH
jgi:transglutaminase-like putative cysteine protease